MTNDKGKKKAVGLQLLSRDATGELSAILQVRGKWDKEKNMPESYPGACQVTVHGGLEQGEDFMQALFRETEEELGNEMRPVVENLFRTGKLQELVNFETPEKQTITYGAIVEKNILNILFSRSKSPSFGGFKLIQSNQVDKIVDLRTLNKEIGVTDKNIIAMFPDEKESLRLAFEKLDF